MPTTIFVITINFCSIVEGIPPTVSIVDEVETGAPEHAVPTLHDANCVGSDHASEAGRDGFDLVRRKVDAGIVRSLRASAL